MPECFAVKSHYALDINGNRMPCCLYVGQGHNDPLTSQHFSEISFDDYRASKEFQDLKNTLQSGKWHPGCIKCKQQEDIGIRSLRQSNNLLFSHKETNNDNIEYVEITLGNDCNLSCRMCAPNWSTDYIKLIENNNNLKQYVEFGNNDLKRISYTVEEMFDNVDLTHCKAIKYIGGEPFVTPQFKKLLEYLDKKGILSEVGFITNTNATFFPSKYMDLLNKAKYVMLAVSLEGIGPRDDYIRNGSNWNIKKNVIQQYATKTKFILSGHAVIGALNVDQVMLLEINSKKLGLHSGMHLSINTSPSYLTFNALPPTYVKEIIDPFNEKFLRNYTFDPVLFERLKKFTVDYDNATGKSIKQYHPILAKHFD